jgi:hypothetical protein
MSDVVRKTQSSTGVDVSKETPKSVEEAASFLIVNADLPVATSALELAAGLLDTSGCGSDVTQDVIVSLPVMRPDTAQFFRIHPELHGDLNILKQKSGKGEELYAVVPGMVHQIDNVRKYTLFLGVHRDGSHFLWPISATSSDGYSRSARQIAITAMKTWCRLVSVRSTGVYICRQAPQCKEIPVWPENKTFVELLALAFGDGRIIDSPEHPVVKEMWLR